MTLDHARLDRPAARIPGGAAAGRRRTSDAGTSAAMAAAVRRRRTRHVDVHAGDAAMVAARLRRHARGVGRAAHRSSRHHRSASRPPRIAAGRRRCCCSARGRGRRGWRRRRASTSQTVLSARRSLLIIALTIAALLLARYNVRARRADRARRRAARAVRHGRLRRHVCRHGAPRRRRERRRPNLFRRNFGTVLIDAGMLWVDLPRARAVRAPLLARRHSRLDAPARPGYVRDPRVGRDLLTGCVIGTVMGLLREAATTSLPPLFGYPAPTAHISQAIETRWRVRLPTLDFICRRPASTASFVAMFLVLGYVLLRLTLRRTSPGHRRGGDPAGDRSGAAGADSPIPSGGFAAIDQADHRRRRHRPWSCGYGLLVHRGRARRSSTSPANVPLTLSPLALDGDDLEPRRSPRSSA